MKPVLEEQNIKGVQTKINTEIFLVYWEVKKQKDVRILKEKKEENHFEKINTKNSKVEVEHLNQKKVIKEEKVGD